MNETHAPTMERSKVATKPNIPADYSAARAKYSKSPFDLDQLVRRCMGRIELAERLLNSFESRFPEDLSKIEACLGEDDPAAVSRMVHQLKGAAANVSAPDLYSILARMEVAVQSDERSAANHCVEEIHHAWDSYIQSKSSIEQE